MRLFTCFLLLLVAPKTLANECTTIKVGGGNWLDVNELDNLRGSAAGASVLLLHKLPEFIDANIEFDPPVPFARQLKQLEQGKLDVVAGIYPTKQRKQIFQFSDNYYYEKLFIFAKPEKINHITEFKHLRNSIGAKIRGASYGERIDELYKDPDYTIQVNNQEERLRLLLKGRVDYFIGSITAVGYSPLMEVISISKKPIYRQGVALGFSPKTSCQKWIPKINSVIQQYFQAG